MKKKIIKFVLIVMLLSVQNCLARYWCQEQADGTYKFYGASKKFNACDENKNAYYDPSLPSARLPPAPSDDTTTPVVADPMSMPINPDSDKNTTPAPTTPAPGSIEPSSPNPVGIDGTPAPTTSKPSSAFTDEEATSRIMEKKMDPRTWRDVGDLTPQETASEVAKGNIDPKTGTWTDKSLDASAPKWTSPASWRPNDMTSTSFKLDPKFLSPSNKPYNGGAKQNLKDILANIGKYLLIATTTIAVLSIVVGGIMISTTGPSDRAAKGKTIIMLNIAAVILALLSYSIIRLVSWLIA